MTWRGAISITTTGLPWRVQPFMFPGIGWLRCALLSEWRHIWAITNLPRNAVRGLQREAFNGGETLEPSIESSFAISPAGNRKTFRIRAVRSTDWTVVYASSWRRGRFPENRVKSVLKTVWRHNITPHGVRIAIGRTAVKIRKAFTQLVCIHPIPRMCRQW